MRLKDKVAIVTGGGRGIGRGIARMFAREGAKVVIAARTESELDATREMITSEGGQAAQSVTDMAVSADIERMVAHAIDTFGRLDVLVNNAGYGVWGYSIDDDIEEAYDRLMAVNLRGAWIACHHAVGHMKHAGAGSIINVSSVHAWATGATGTAYAASKGGMVAGTRALALELAPHLIRVNCISPGAIEIGMEEGLIEERIGPEQTKAIVAKYADVLDAEKRLYQALPIVGKPEDVAYCAVYLASEESRFVTGTNITVDGGMLAKLAINRDLGPELNARRRAMQAEIDALAEERGESPRVTKRPPK